jgi:hypothetical protein
MSLLRSARYVIDATLAGFIGLKDISIQVLSVPNVYRSIIGQII